MMINDSIYKIKDEDLYIITNGDLNLLDKIEKNLNFKSDKVIKEKHTIKLETTKNKVSNGMQKISDRSLVYYVSNKKREFVTFDAYISGAFLNFNLKGHHQDKFIFWLTPAKDNLVYGVINIKGTSGSNILNDNNPITYNNSCVNRSFFVGSPAYVTFDFEVTYSYKKTNSTAYLGSWGGTSVSTEDSFIKNYNWLNF